MIVMDASAAATMIREGVDGSVFARIGDGGERVLAPSFFRIEASQVAWKCAHVGLVDDRDTQLLARSMISCVDEFVPDDELLAEALAEASRLDHSLYDMLYYVLARRAASPLFTCDRKLAKLCDDTGVACLALVDF